MEKLAFTLLAVAALAAAGCSSLDRSRDLADARVSGTTIAQQVCSNCHGLTGHAVSPNFPNLAGQVESYVVAQLNAFKRHGRQDPAGFEYMWGLSRSLTDTQIEALAAYYAVQRPVRLPPDRPAASLGAGRAIYQDGLPGKNVPACAGCHGSGGEGRSPFPRLAGQHADYVVKQLLVFQRTDERPEGSIMKTVAHDLTGADIAGVAAYVQSLPD